MNVVEHANFIVLWNFHMDMIGAAAIQILKILHWKQNSKMAAKLMKKGKGNKMNNGSYIGRMAKDFSILSSGKMGTGTVAVDRPFPFNKDKDGNQITDFLTIKIIGEDKVKRAEQYLTKGTKIAFTGITCKDTSKDDQGNWKEFNYIMVNGWEFAESKGSGSNTAPQVDADGFMNLPDGIDEELPFN